MDIIVTKDGSRYCVSNDTDFWRMLLETIGEDAAAWYQGRMARIGSLLDEMRPLFPPEEDMRCGGGYDYKEIAKIGTDKLTDIAVIAYEIPGWDE